jgi:mannosyltransferase
MWMSDDPATVSSAGERGYGLSHTSAREVIALVLVIAVGAVVRFYHIGGLPLWTDEGFSEWASRQSTWYLWTVLPGFETNPPLYYTLLKGWRVLFGDSEAALRSLSALFGIATIPLVFAMGRMLGTRRSGWVSGLLAAALFALSPVHVQYAQEARAYAMLAFGVAVAMTGAMWLMLHPTQVCGLADQSSPSKGRVPQMLGLFALGMALIMWSHDTGALAVLAIALPVIYWWIVDANRCPRALVRLLIASAIAFALFLPYLAPLLSHMGHVRSSFWIQVPDRWVIEDTITRLVGGPSKWNVAVIVFGALAAFAITSLWRHGRRSIAILLVSVGLLPILAELLVSFLAMPVFLERTLIYVDIPLYIAVGYAISRIQVAYLEVAGAVIVLALLGISLHEHFRDFSKEPWDKIAAYLSRSLQPGQPVLLVPAWVTPALEYYADRQGAAFRMVGVPADWPEPSHSQPAADAVPVPSAQKIETADMGRVARLTRNSQRVGLVLRLAELHDPDSLTLREIRKTHVISESRKFQSVTVIIFSGRKDDDDGRKK